MKRFKKQAPILGIAILLLVAMVGGTFAYFSQTSTASNYLSAKNYDSTLTETFTPPTDGNFTPGVEYAKVVGVTNTGDVGMLVRIKYQEFWGTTENTSLDFLNPASGWYDELPETDSYVAKKAGATTSNTNGDWLYGGDGYYYFMAELAPTESTDSFIEAIKLKLGSMTTTISYNVIFWNNGTKAYTTVATYADNAAITAALALLPAGSYVSSKVENKTSTLAQAGDYELRFTAETVQAVPDAATAWASTANAAVDVFLATVN